MVFQRCLSESKFPKFSRTILSILTDLNNIVVWTQLFLWFTILPMPFPSLWGPFKMQLVSPSSSCSTGFLYYYYYYYFTPWEFFTSALADGFLLKFEWQQISSSFQDTSQYSGRSQQCYSLDSLYPSRYLKVLQSLYQSFGDCTKSTNYNWYNR